MFDLVRDSKVTNAILSQYKYKIIFCSESHIDSIKECFNDLTFIATIENRKVQEFKTGLYEGEIIKDIFNKIDQLSEVIDVYYNYQLINKVYKKQLKITFIIYFNLIMSKMCLQESNNLQEAIKTTE